MNNIDNYQSQPSQPTTPVNDLVQEALTGRITYELVNDENHVLQEYGQNSSDWLEIVSSNNMRSGPIYQKFIINLLQWKEKCFDKSGFRTDDLNECVKEYFSEKHKLVDADTGKLLHAATSMMSWFSILKKFYKYTKRGILAQEVPLVEDNIRFWAKEHVVKKAVTFTKLEWG